MSNQQKKPKSLILPAALVATGLSIGFTPMNAAAAPDKPTQEIAGKSQSSVKGLSGKTVPNPVVGEIIVKCAGNVKKGMNHCGANGHPCGGKAAVDNDKNEWVYLRAEKCNKAGDRIVGMKRVTKG